MTKLCYWNDGSPKVIPVRNGSAMIEGVGVVLNPKPLPEKGVFFYVEEGPTLASPGKILTKEVQNDGLTVRLVRSEVDAPDFDWVSYNAMILAGKISAIKAEANRRILAICPEWKQRNLTAQAAQLAKKGESNWTVEETQAWADGEALWLRIAAIRAASDALEASPPDNVQDDQYWPEAFTQTV